MKEKSSNTVPVVSKNLMTGPKGNNEFSFPKILNVPNFPLGSVIKCFAFLTNSKIERSVKKLFA